MIDLYSWLTPNGDKVHIMLEECRLPYVAHPVNIGAGDQFKRKFLKISPNNRIPAIVDTKGPGGRPYALFESGAILMYLAEKSGKFWPKRTRERYDVAQWLMFQMGNIGPMMGQAYHFRKYAPKRVPYGITRYSREVKRLYGVLDSRLKDHEYLADRYSIADMANWPWVRHYKGVGLRIGEFPHVKRWIDAIGARPAVERGMAVLSEYRKLEEAPMTRKAREVLYGKTQFKRR